MAKGRGIQDSKGKKATKTGRSGERSQPDQPGSDLTAFNTARLILDSVGPSLLTTIASNYLDLLGTSLAVYEKNGDYAFGIFSLGWCQFMNQSSRRMCNTQDDRQALASGTWLCHESCWNDASRQSIETGSPVDIECRGGIRLFAVPIHAGTEIIGSINFGYGNPPKAPATLRNLASRYGVSVQELTKKAGEHNILSQFHIGLAKKQLSASARLIGEIVERMQAERALRESIDKITSILRVAPTGIGVVTNRILEEVNDRIREMTGYSREELLGKSARMLYPSDEDYEFVGREKYAQITKRNTGTVETRWQRKDGTIINVLLSSTPIHADNLAAGVTFTALDITERKRMEEMVKKLNRENEEALRIAHMGHWEFDVCAGIFTFNDQYYSLHRTTAKDAGGYQMTAEEFARRYVHAEDAWLVGHAIQKALETDDPNFQHHMEGRILCGDNTVRWVIVWFRIEKNAQGKTVKMLGVEQDITERKQALEERAKLEDQIREVQKLESLGVLAGGIAHDFNNILMAILGNADLALHTLPLDSPSRTNVDEIVRASHLAADLCRQMLAYSGRGRYVIGDYDISEVIREMAHMLEISVSKKAALRYTLAKDLPLVKADVTQIRQIVMNLITNASEALGEANGVIAISTGAMDCNHDYLADSHLGNKLPAGKYVYLEVSDTGSGMNRETQARIFEPFFTTKFTGRGLGLAAVIGIVRGHKGAIKVSSELGKGTTFVILLPIAEEAPGERIPSMNKKELRSMSGTILLVDDESSVRDVGSKMLESLGFQSLIAANGREAMEIVQARKHEILCVILDLTMPEMDGEEVLRELLRLRSDLRVILSSGYSEQEVTQRFARKGLAGFIQKPYTVSILQDALNRVLS